MDNKVDITHKEWTDNQKEIVELKQKCKAFRFELNEHEEEIEAIKEKVLVMPIDFKKSLEPLNDMINKQSDSYMFVLKEQQKEWQAQNKELLALIEEQRVANEKLAKDLIETKNEKYKIAYDTNQKIIYLIITTIILFFLGNALNNVFGYMIK